MHYLIDTHVLIWIATDSRQIPGHIHALLKDERSSVLISAVTMWEICQLIYYKRLKLGVTPQEMIHLCEQSLDARTLPFDAACSYHLENLPPIHKDPFDRMLICQAIEHGLAIVTNDKLIRQYPIRTLW